MARKKKTYKPTLLLDFDGVIHSYTSGWQGVDVIPDLPVLNIKAFPKKKGTTKPAIEYSSIEWVEELVLSNLFEVCIYSSRSKERKGISAMKAWFETHGMNELVLDGLQFPKTKPATFLTIDDRAIKFEGTFMSPEDIAKFKTWQGK